MSSSFSRRLMTPIALATAAVVGGLAVTTGAVFNNTQTVAGNNFTAGTVVLGADPVSDAFNVSNMAPGDVVTEPITIQNTGSLSLRYALESVATGNLTSALTLAIKTGVTDCTNTGFTATGTSLYGVGPLGTPSGMPVFGDKTQGPDVGDRTLDPTGSEVLCMQVTLPGAATDNTYQNQTGTVAFDFYAEQTAHNGLTLVDPNSASAGAIFATVASNQTSVDVSWPASNDKHVTGYNLYRTTDSGTTWQQIASTGSTITSYADNTTSQGTTYGYAVQAVGFDGSLTPLPTTPEASATVSTPRLAAPAAPASVKTNQNDSVNHAPLTITWAASTGPNLTGYTIYRSADNDATRTALATVGAGTTSYIDTTGVPGTLYVYSVAANGQGNTTSSRTAAALMAYNAWILPYTSPQVAKGNSSGELWSPNGMYMWVMQGDLTMVIYRCDNTPYCASPNVVVGGWGYTNNAATGTDWFTIDKTGLITEYNNGSAVHSIQASLTGNATQMRITNNGAMEFFDATGNSVGTLTLS